ncbi:phasin family protein [uncultured Tateyamaria sp.]|uniref:phasin family protein n=1 Tax=uncultured Tateyamaria sp. TaxID=455651 RepID=UPI002612E9B4|nr:phasin family protein [uncultured Tateyamaria sp.]
MPKSTPPKISPAPMAAALTAFNPATAQAWMEITTECTRFAMDRVQKDFAAQRAMMACTSPTELMTLQSSYCRDAAQEYADQATRMVEMMTKATAQVTEGIASPTSRKYDDIPL